ncbi:MAG: T9SS type A sorting domain-containing protein [Saprospiraceae bacterium]|nr:T9SS type A sorting domain-containing protein [Saprospiraceae bacterium]
MYRSHMVLDKPTGWLYVVDTGNDRVLRLDINSGNVVGDLPLINEILAEHSEMGNVTWEVIIQDVIDRPCGIEIMGNRLLVGDYTSGDIYVYDMSNDFQEMGRIKTGSEGLTGIKIGPTGHIWYTNKLENTVTHIEPGMVSSIGDEALAAKIRLSPIPVKNTLFVDLTDLALSGETTLQLSDVSGKEVLYLNAIGDKLELPLGHLSDGTYWLNIQSNGQRLIRKVIVTK